MPSGISEVTRFGRKLVLLTTVLLLLLKNVYSTHFAYGTHRWYKPDPIGNPRKVIIRANYAIRWSYGYFHAEGGSGGRFGYPPVDSVISLYRFPATFRIYGNGRTWTKDLHSFKVTYVQSQDDWFNGYQDVEFIAPDMSDVEYTAEYEGQNRLSTLMDNNRDVMWKIRCNFNVADGRTRGPITTGSNRIYAENGVPFVFFLPYSKGDAGCKNGCQLEFSFPPKAYSNLNTVHPSGMQLDQKTGKVEWIPSSTGLYSVQFLFKEVISDPIVTGSNPSITPLYVVLDTVIQVVAKCEVGSNCNQAPHFSPPEPKIYSRDICNVKDVALQEKGYCGFYRSITKVIEINAVDYNTDQTVTVDYTLLPAGASVDKKPGEVFIVKDDPYETKFPAYKRKAWSTYTFSWTATIESVETPVCFTARDSLGKKSYVQYCLTIGLINAKTIYLSGVVRDFDENEAYFNYENQVLDDGAAFVEDRLGSDGKPVYKVGNWKSVSKESFDTWYNPSPRTKSSVYSITLIQLDDTKNVFTFDQKDFTPINGKLFGDIGDKNTGFTYELHTYVKYEQGAEYSFSSSDDLWVFIDGKLPPNWGLAGVHNLKSQTIKMDELAKLWNLQADVDYRLDIFYASRTKNKEPALTLELPETLLCDAISGSGTLEYDFKDRTFSPGTSIVNIADAGISNGNMYMITTDQQSAALWASDASKKSIKVKVMQGFETTFTFKMGSVSSNGDSKGTSEGFAFVMQADNGETQGGGGVQLGYGGLKNAIAIEFDCVYDGNMNDPNYQHVAIQIGSPNQPLSSIHGDGVTGGITAYDALSPEALGSAPKFTFDNGTAHTVRIQYVPSRDEANTVKVGFIRVWINEVLRPVVEASVDGNMLRQMFSDGAAFVGFTAGSSRTRKETITISKWEYKVVPPSAADTDFTVALSDAEAGEPKIAIVQARDACGNAIGVGEDPSVFTTKYVESSTGRELTKAEVDTSVTSNFDGTYNVRYVITKATDIQVHLMYKGEEIKGSGKQITIRPAAANYLKSELIVPTLPVAKNTASGNALYLMYFDKISEPLLSITSARNTKICGDSACASAFIDAHKEKILMLAVTGIFRFTDDLKSTLNSLGASNLQVSGFTGVNSYAFIRDPYQNKVNDSYVPKGETGEISISDVNGLFRLVARSSSPERAGYLNVVYSRVEYPAGIEQREVYIVVRDKYGNLQTSGTSALSSTFETSTLGGYEQTSISQSTPGYYMLKVNSTKQGLFALTVRLDGESIKNSPKQIEFSAGLAIAEKSYITGSGVKNARAGDDMKVRIVLVDKYNNIANTERAVTQNTVSASLTHKDTQDATPVPMKWDKIDTESKLAYMLTKAALYQWSVTVNGEALALTGQEILTVVAGELSPETCTIGSTMEDARKYPGVNTISEATAGILKVFYIQARDRYGNVRNNENPTSGAFQVAFSGKKIEDGSYSIIYERGSPHKVQFIPEEAPGNIVLSLTSGGVVFPTANFGAYNLQVNVGPASILSELVVDNSVTTAVAGEKTKFTVKCKDSKGNVIAPCPKNSFIFGSTLFGSKLGVFSGETSLDDSISIEFNATKASDTSYVLTSAPSETATGSIINTPHSVNIVHGDTHPPACKPPIYPPGYGAGGKAGDTAIFRVQARDRYGNSVKKDNDKVTAKITAEDKTTDASVTSKGNGLYEIEYTVPSSTSGTFTISYSVNDILVETIEGKSFDNAQKCFIVWGKSESYKNAAATVVAGDSTTKIPIPVVQSNDGKLLNVTVENFQVSFNGPAFYTSSTTVSDMRAIVTLPSPTIKGIYNMTIMREGIFPCYQYQQKDSFDETSEGDVVFQLTVDAADADKDQSYYENLPSPLGVTADAGSSFTVVLRDRYGNLVEDTESKYKVSAKFSLDGEETQFDESSHSEGTYTVTYALTDAGTYEAAVYFLESENKIQIRQPARVVIEPGAPSNSNSEVELLSANPVTAGTNIEFKITFRDKNRNIVTNLVRSKDSGLCLKGSKDGSKSYCLQVEGLDNPTVEGVGGVSGSPSEFRVRKQETVAKILIVSFKLEEDDNPMDGLISGKSLTVEVEASAVDGTKSYVTDQVPTAAGEPISFNFFARDAYGNEILKNPGLMYVAIPNSGQVQAQYSDKVDSSIDGKYVVILQEGFTQRVSDQYVWSFRTASSVVDITAGNVPGSIGNAAALQNSNVVPGAAVASKSKLPSKGIPDALVNTEVTISVEFADQYGNKITNETQLKFEMAKIDIQLFASNTTSLDIVSYSAADCAVEVDTDGDEPVLTTYDFANVFSPIETSVTAGHVDYKLKPKAAGGFRVSFVHRNDPNDYLSCVSSQVLTVLPGSVHPPSSKLMSVPNDESSAVDYLQGETVKVKAGTSRAIGVRLYDELSNLVEGDCVHSSSILLETNSNGALNPKEWSVRNCINEFRTYAIDFVALKAGTYNFVVKYSGQNGVMGGKEDGTKVEVVPADLSSFLINHGSNTPRAGYPHTFSILATDAYGNEATLQSNPTYKVSIQLRNEDPYSLLRIPILYEPKFEMTLDQQSGQTKVAFTSTKEGKFTINVTMYVGGTFAKSTESTLTLESMQCSGSTPFRCESTAKCVASYKDCIDNVCTSDNAKGTCVQCQDGSFKDSIKDCNCATSGMVRCPAGNCAPDGLCFAEPQSGTEECPVLCWDGGCRKDSKDCPAKPVCVPGYTMCDDGRTCVPSDKIASLCPPVSTCKEGFFLCPTGDCKASYVDCSTPTTCSKSTDVLCPDGSCESSVLLCVAPAPCPKDRPYVCPDGSCSPELDKCASSTSCNPGNIRCEDGSCASSVDMCQAPSTCSSPSIKCADGSCASNIFSCPTPQTCPSDYVLCSNGECVEIASWCAKDTQCPSGTTRCSDGSCSAGESQCPTSIQCPAEFPIRCASDGACKKTREECCDLSKGATCGQTFACSASKPFRCADGVCVTDLLDCPTGITCPALRPIKCPDSSCVASSEMCSSPLLIKCPLGTIRCKTGECVTSVAFCPVQTTCPTDFTRCEDGYCRSKCEAMVPNVFCPESTPVLCPITTQGQVCAKSIQYCTQAAICEGVRCFDGSCVAELLQCPSAPTVGKEPTADRKPCPDGTFVTAAGSDPSLDYCPPVPTCESALDFKCGDGTCTSVLSDCKNVDICPLDSQGNPQYRCGTGICASDPNSATCSSTGTTSSTGGLCKSTEFLCPTGECVPDWINDCPKHSTDTVTLSECPVSQVRCIDKTCRNVCPTYKDIVCSVYLPFSCPDGMCARNESECNHPETGCPYHSPVRCWTTGNCVEDSSKCPQESKCKEGEQSCFGFCFPKGSTKCASIEKNQCDADKPFRCFDNVCVKDLKECTANTYSVATSNRNVCPLSNPYRCSNGFCAKSSTACPTITSGRCTEPSRSIYCADGSCVSSSDLCPIVTPCVGGQRCPDGSCRSTEFIDEYNCPSNSNCIEGERMCPNGLCSVASVCLNEVGCPVGRIKCSDGTCVAQASECKILSSTNGCPSESPIKCQTGACKKSPADCAAESDGKSVAETGTGCPKENPIRCVDGSCKAQENMCLPVVLCEPLEKLCANFLCVLDSRQCSAVTSTACEAGEFKCNDLTCKASREECESSCPPTAPILCPTGECVLSLSRCQGVVRQNLVQAEPCAHEDASSSSIECDASFSIGTSLATQTDCEAKCSLKKLCKAYTLSDDGTCVLYERACKGGDSVTSRRKVDSSCGGAVGETNEQDAYRLAADGCPDDKPFKCFDQSCKATMGECINKRLSSDSTIQNPTVSAEIETKVCGKGFVLCHDGTCAPQKENEREGANCPIIPRCPAKTYRCIDGSCSSTSCSVSLGSCPGGLKRCEDGVCRNKCLQFDGCPLSAPFHCFERTCARSADSCVGTLRASPDGYGISTARRRLLSPVSEIGDEKPIPCHTNCNADEKALAVKLFLDTNTEASIPIATKNGKGVEISWLKFPSGSLVFDANHSGPQFQVRPVSDSYIREAENAIHVSRQKEFGDKTGFTLPATVLSSAFECVTEAKSPFQIEIVHRALIDYTRVPANEDVCLAYLYRIPSLNYARWECLTRGPKQSETNPALVEAAITDCGAQGQGKVYAFIHNPAPGPAEAAVDPRSWLQKNFLYVLGTITLLAIIMLIIMYAIARLKRYREKFHKERDNVKKMEEEVMDMEMFGGGLHQKNDSLVLTGNPMQMQLTDLQKKLDKTEIEMLEAENKQRLAASKERQKKIQQIREDRERLAKELEATKKALEDATVMPVVFRTSDVQRKESPGSNTGGSSGGSGDGNVPATSRQRTKEKRAFGAAKPKGGRKKKSLG